MSINCETHEFCVPQKEIKRFDNLRSWAESEAYQDLMGLLVAVNTALRGAKTPPSTAGSDVIQRLVCMLDTLSAWVDDIDPIDQPQRFGNKAFRTFFCRLEERAESLLRAALPERLHRAVPELAVYLTESVGNAIRIDYGTGHELAFVMLLCALFKVEALSEADLADTALVLFSRYLQLVRRLQQRYRMEPAGSQGVWSLDDHQFVPFIWGSAQLIDHPRVRPSAIANEEMVHALAADYMFFSSIQHILTVKTGPFAEHSNQLWNISAVPHWSKVNSGLLKMYRGEVLSKFPVIQHCRFGSILRIAPAAERAYELSVPPAVLGAGLTSAPLTGMPRPRAVPVPAGRMPAPGEAAPRRPAVMTGMPAPVGKAPTSGAVSTVRLPAPGAPPPTERDPTPAGDVCNARQ